MKKRKQNASFLDGSNIEIGMLSANARHEEFYRLALTTGLAFVQELPARLEVTASTFRRGEKSC